MRKAHALVLAGLGAAALAGAASATSRDTHILTVNLPDGSVAKIEYVGHVAPKVRIEPAPVTAIADPFGFYFPSALEMLRQIDAMMRQVQQVGVKPVAGAPGMNVAAYGNMPAGSSSVTVVSTSNGAKTCTRTTEVTSQGAGKAPKVVSNVSGDCAAAPTAPQKVVNPT